MTWFFHSFSSTVQRQPARAYPRVIKFIQQRRHYQYVVLLIEIFFFFFLYRFQKRKSLRCWTSTPFGDICCGTTSTTWSRSGFRSTRACGRRTSIRRAIQRRWPRSRSTFTMIRGLMSGCGNCFEGGRSATLWFRSCPGTRV